MEKGRGFVSNVELKKIKRVVGGSSLQAYREKVEAGWSSDPLTSPLPTALVCITKTTKNTPLAFAIVRVDISLKWPVRDRLHLYLC